MRVSVASAGGIGPRAGGRQSVAMPLGAIGGGATVAVSAPLGASAATDEAARLKAAEEQASREARRRADDLVQAASQNSFGGRPSGFGEAFKVLYQRWLETGETWKGFVEGRSANRDDDPDKGGPRIEVRAQWLADP